MAGEDGFAEQDFAMPVRKGRERGPGGEIALIEIAVKTAKKLLEGVGKAFVVASRVLADPRGRRRQQTGIACQ